MVSRLLAVHEGSSHARSRRPHRAQFRRGVHHPPEHPESDGTLEWNATTLVLVSLHGGGHEALGYTYADTATARLLHDRLLPMLEGRDALQRANVGQSLLRSIRNLGRPGIALMALSAIDCALWDLKGRLLDAPLVELLGAALPMPSAK